MHSLTALQNMLNQLRDTIQAMLYKRPDIPAPTRARLENAQHELTLASQEIRAAINAWPEQSSSAQNTNTKQS